MSRTPKLHHPEPKPHLTKDSNHLEHTPAPTNTKAGLVKEIKTSCSLRHNKGINRCRKVFIAAIREHRRYARKHDLYAACLTLTYADPNDFSSNHISNFLRPLRSAMYRKKLKLCYIWRLERSLDGVLHYHTMIWLKRGKNLTTERLAELWPHGCTQVEAAKSPLAWAKYISKSSKPSGKLPKGVRSYDRGGFDEEGAKAVRRALFPLWLKKRVPVSESAKRVKDLGWVNEVTGEVLVSPYIWTGRGILLRDACRDLLHLKRNCSDIEPKSTSQYPATMRRGNNS